MCLPERDQPRIVGGLAAHKIPSDQPAPALGEVRWLGEPSQQDIEVPQSRFRLGRSHPQTVRLSRSSNHHPKLDGDLCAGNEVVAFLSQAADRLLTHRAERARSVTQAHEDVCVNQQPHTRSP